MKYALPLLAIALLAATGCQDSSKSTTMTPANPTVTDVGMAPAPIPTATPAAYETVTTPPANPAMSTPTMDSSASLSSSAAGSKYTVKAGDTLWKIAATHYGNGNQWKKIADANPGLSPSALKVGQTINIP
jgi:5'-nucleotidase